LEREISARASGRLEYICSNQDCQEQIFFDKFEDQWYVRIKKEIPEEWEE